MPSVVARLACARPERYLTQFCRHAAAMGSARAQRIPGHAGRAETVTARWTDAEGTVVVDPVGRIDLSCGTDAVTVRVEARDDAALDRLSRIVERDFARFSRGALAVRWED
jgi:hypothetical protein